VQLNQNKGREQGEGTARFKPMARRTTVPQKPQKKQQQKFQSYLVGVWPDAAAADLPGVQRLACIRAGAGMVPACQADRALPEPPQLHRPVRTLAGWNRTGIWPRHRG